MKPVASNFFVAIRINVDLCAVTYTHLYECGAQSVRRCVDFNNRCSYNFQAYNRNNLICETVLSLNLVVLH